MHNVNKSGLKINFTFISRNGNCHLKKLSFRHSLITQVCTDFDVCIKLTVFEQFRPPDYENDFGFALSRLVFSQIVFS
jgi:hypothetical protein